MRITFEVKESNLREKAARAVAALQAYGVIKEIAFDPWDEWVTMGECVKRGLDEEKLTEVLQTKANRHLLLPVVARVVASQEYDSQSNRNSKVIL